MVIAVAFASLIGLAALPPAAAKSRHADKARHVTPPVHLAKVPLPQPRPADAPQRDQAKATPASEPAKSGSAKTEPAKEEAKAPVPPPPSACRVALTEDIAIAPSVPAIHGPGECGGDDLVRLEAIVLPDKKRVALTPAATMRCTMATELANWVRNDVAPEVAKLGSEVSALDNFDAYQCRGRNGKSGAPLSEHGRANAIDVHGFKLADGRMIELTDRTEPRELRESLLHSACTRFTTVLGPDSDWYHENHIHLDLMQRHNDYRICQWDVLDPMPKVAPLLPEERPQEASPRAVADAGQGGNGAKARSGASVGEAVGEAKTASGKTSPDKPRDQQTAGNGVQRQQASPEANADKSAAPKLTSPARGAEQTTGSTGGSEKSMNKPSVDSEPRSEAIADMGRQAKPPAPDKASAEKVSTNKVAIEKAGRRKLAADRAVPSKHRRRARIWNPFASFF
ncbi:extensin family protein [Bradyrhizobium sp. SZCCHNS2096]|uniref:extensin family protein n=1 Tax=Bradyrhizobium sp. SZCCHNS2096 TaxID=3057309 RepID=UPI002915EC44|nr:extensin family protein [Bradyrhizobium sp. SZCCHNS2096]